MAEDQIWGWALGLWLPCGVVKFGVGVRDPHFTSSVLHHIGKA